MKEIKDKLTKEYIENKYNELVNEKAPITTLKNIESFLNNNEIDLIKDTLIEKLKDTKKGIIENIDTSIRSKNKTIDLLKDQIKEYEKDLNELEKLKSFKRKSKLFGETEEKIKEKNDPNFGFNLIEKFREKTDTNTNFNNNSSVINNN